MYLCGYDKCLPISRSSQINELFIKFYVGSVEPFYASGLHCPDKLNIRDEWGQLNFFFSFLTVVYRISCCNLVKL